MTPNPEYVMELAAKIIDARKSLESLHAEWDAIFNPTSVATPQRAVRDGSFSARVEAVILAEPGRSFSIAEVAEKLGEEDTLKVGRTLFRLYNTKRIANPNRGMYSTKPVLEEAA